MPNFKDDDYKSRFRDAEYETVEIDPEVEEKIEKIELESRRRRPDPGSVSGGGFWAALWAMAKIALFLFVLLPLFFYLFVGALGLMALVIPVFIGLFLLFRLLS